MYVISSASAENGASARRRLCGSGSGDPLRQLEDAVPGAAGPGHVQDQAFKEFPPRQKAATFSIDQVVEKMAEASKAA